MKRQATIIAMLILMAFSLKAIAQLPSPLPDIDVNAVQSDRVLNGAFAPASRRDFEAGASVSLMGETPKTALHRYPVHNVTFPNGVEGMTDLVYQQIVDYRPLKLDLYLPPSSIKPPETGFPLVIFIHGGGWISGDTEHSAPFVDFPGVLASLSAKGYAVASIEYRFSGEAKFPAQIQDVKAAIRWLKLKATKYNINPMRTVTWGVSAGGYLSGLAGVSCDAPALEPNYPKKSDSQINVDDCVQGSVAWYGAFDIATIRKQAREDRAMSRDVPIAFIINNLD